VHAQNQEAAMDELRNMMRPELINRMDKIVVFKALTKPEVRTILDIELGKLAKRLQRQRLGLQVTPSAKNMLLQKGYDAQNGVRPLRRALQDTVEDEIAAGLLDERYTKGDVITVTAKKGELAYAIKPE
jgi:ATP-dependent Clp protease ATP-binding subunit ClpC